MARMPSKHAVPAARRIFARMNWVGLDRETILWSLGEPNTPDFRSPEYHAENTEYVYSVGSGSDRRTWRLRFENGVVHSVDGP